MILTYPAKRDDIYQIFAMHKNEEPYVELDAEIPYKLLEFECHSMEEFYQKFFDNRKIMGLDDTLPPVLSKEEQWAIYAEKFDNYCWREDGEYYSHHDVHYHCITQDVLCRAVVFLSQLYRDEGR